MSKEIEELKQEIERLQNIALEQFEEKRVPHNNKNHQRLMKLKKQLERLQKEGER